VGRWKKFVPGENYWGGRAPPRIIAGGASHPEKPGEEKNVGVGEGKNNQGEMNGGGEKYRGGFNFVFFFFLSLFFLYWWGRAIGTERMRGEGVRGDRRQSEPKESTKEQVEDQGRQRQRRRRRDARSKGGTNPREDAWEHETD